MYLRVIKTQGFTPTHKRQRRLNGKGEQTESSLAQQILRGRASRVRHHQNKAREHFVLAILQIPNLRLVLRKSVILGCLLKSWKRSFWV